MAMSIGSGGGYSAPVSRPVAQASAPAPQQSDKDNDSSALQLLTSGPVGTQVNKLA